MQLQGEWFPKRVCLTGFCMANTKLPMTVPGTQNIRASPVNNPGIPAEPSEVNETNVGCMTEIPYCIGAHTLIRHDRQKRAPHRAQVMSGCTVNWFDNESSLATHVQFLL